MSLEKSTPYRNAWYRDLLEKEAELKQYTDDKVAQAIELPEVTSEDNGDILQVINGAWAKGAEPKGVKIFNCTDDADPILADEKTMGDLIQAFNDDYLVIIRKTYNSVTTEYIMTSLTADGAPVFIGHYSYDNKEYATYLLGSTTASANTLTGHACMIPPQPTVSGKILKSSGRSWVVSDPELPAVTGADDGKVLGVASGAWGAVTPSSKGLVIFNINSSNILLDNKTFADVKAAILDGNDVALKQDEYLFRLIYSPTNTYTGVYFIKFRFLDNNVAVTALYGNLDTASANEFNLTSVFRCVPSAQVGSTRKLLTARGAIYEYIDLELPTVSASDNGNVLAVVNGAWAKSAPNLIKSIQFVNGQALSDDDYASIKANTNVRGIYSDASKYIIFELSSCNFMQTEFEFVNYAERLKANIDTNKVVTITEIPVTSSPIPISSSNSINNITVEGGLI